MGGRRRTGKPLEPYCTGCIRANELKNKCTGWYDPSGCRGEQFEPSKLM